MVKVLALCALAILACASCDKTSTYTCDVYYYDSGAGGWGYVFSEDYDGTSASDAEENCENDYGAYYDCRDCS